MKGSMANRLLRKRRFRREWRECLRGEEEEVVLFEPLRISVLQMMIRETNAENVLPLAMASDAQRPKSTWAATLAEN